MAGPFYKVYMGRALAPWYQLTPEERTSLIAKLNEAFEQAGGKRLVQCDTSWSTDQWAVAGVEEFPDLEAVQRYSAALNELNWFQYIEGQSVLGTRWEEPGETSA